jgi:hypothetical protein
VRILIALLCLGVSGFAQTINGVPNNQSVSLNNNVLINSPAATFFCETDSIGLPQTGDFCPQIQGILGLTSASINNVGSATGADMASCATAGAGNCTQNGTYPLTFPLGVVNNSKTLLEVYGYNDLSVMGSVPTNPQLSYFSGGLKSRVLQFGIPDAQKIAANNTTYCTGSGWTAAPSTLPGGVGTFPAGSLQTSTNGATLTCTGLNATDAGFIMLKNVSSSATFTITVTNPGTSGSPFSVSDPYTGSTTLNETAAYTSAWGAVSDFYAVGYPNGAGQPSMSGGYTTITLTNTSTNALYVVGPYFISPSSSAQNAPAVEVMLETRAGCNGTCSSVAGTQHNDSNTNVMRTAQTQVVNELRNNGILVSYFDPNATPTGYNPSDTSQTSRVSVLTVSSGGSGYTTAPAVTVTGCTVAPTFAVTISGGAVVTGAYNALTSGSCLGGSPSVAFSGGGGTGAAGTTAVVSDGTHPNYPGGTGIALTAAPLLNSAATIQDHFLLAGSGNGGCINNCTISDITGATAALTLQSAYNLALDIHSSSALGTYTCLQGTGTDVDNWCMGSIGNSVITGGKTFLLGDISSGLYAMAVTSASSGAGFTEINSLAVDCWATSNNITLNSCDTGLSRDAAGVVDVGNGSQGDKSGIIKMARIVQGGTPVIDPGIAAILAVGDFSGGTGGFVSQQVVSGVTNERIFDSVIETISGHGALVFRIANDTYGTTTSWLTLTRSGTTPTLAAFGEPISATGMTDSALGSAMTKAVSGVLTNAVAGTDFVAPPVSNAISSATGGSGTGTVACATASCTNLRGSYTVAGGTFATGTLLTLVWPTTTTAYVCIGNVLNNATGASIGYHSVATATGMTFSSLTAATGLSVDIDYSCQP